VLAHTPPSLLYVIRMVITNYEYNCLSHIHDMRAKYPNRFLF